MRDFYRTKTSVGWFFLICFVLLRSAEAQEPKRTYTITGNVVDGRTSEALVGANVSIRGTTLGSATDRDGKFSILAALPPGAYKIAHSFIGYKSKVVDVRLGEQAIVEVGRVVLQTPNSLNWL